MAELTSIWLFVVVGGPILLGAALAWGILQSGKRDRQVDPNRSAYDPARGMGPR